MVKLFQKVLGKKIFGKLEAVKKSFWPTAHDKAMLRFEKDQYNFYKTFIAPGNLCFDIGGNIGVKTGVFLSLQAKVITLEPQQKCVDILKDKYEGKAIIIQKGVGASMETREFFVSNNSQLSSFKNDWLEGFKETRFSGSAINKIEKIDIITLDSLIETYGKPDFIKIDVEGFEMEVLKGLNLPFVMLSFEYAVPEKSAEVLACLKELQNKFKNLLCNYAVCQESSFINEVWMPIQQMIMHVQTDAFTSSFAGDIYVKNIAD